MIGLIIEVLTYALVAVILGVPIVYPFYKIYKWLKTMGKTPCVVFTRGGVVPAYGDLDLDAKVLRIKNKKLSKDEIGFTVDPKDAQPFISGWSVKQGFFLDLESRRSVNMMLRNPTVQMEPNKEKLALDYLSRKEFWKARMEVAKMRLSMILIMLMAGAGLYSLIRMFLSAMGIYVP